MENYKELYDEWMGNRKKLGKITPDELKGFGEFHNSTMKEGALDKKTKELIAVATAVTAKCEWCIAIHVKKSLELGATKEEILESAWVAGMMG